MKRYLYIIFAILSLNSFAAQAGGVYLQPDEFINQVFDNAPPKARVLWLKKELKKQIADILDHKYKGLRIRYWQRGDGDNRKSAWILEETGKKEPITTGIVIKDNQIELIKVLVFRESRGWEVRHDFFTDQFKQAKLKKDHRLSQTIDNISGATLSVRAVKKLARIALLLDQTIQNETDK
ncbi:MAG TPA: FMN-binding protein [Gammaproteobacteria bacterium]|nr:FMN-binding protein [Gammaproteobacteria bacterium]